VSAGDEYEPEPVDEGEEAYWQHELERRLEEHQRLHGIELAPPPPPEVYDLDGLTD
jgi:hypothetical protein